MKIFHLIPALSGGGAERQLSYLAPELVRMGHDVHIAYLNEGHQKPEIPGVTLYHLKSRSNYDPYLLWQLVHLIRCINPDIMHTWILQADILGGIVAKLHKITWILREPSSAMAYPPTWKNRLRAWVGSGANAIVSNSRSGDEYWRTQLPYSRHYVIPNGLPVHEIERTPAALPSGLVQPETLPIVLYVGRLIMMKNLRSFFEAMAYVRQQQEVLVVLCGEGPLRSELEALRHKLGLDACIHFTGYLPATLVWALMKKASVFVSLSTYEGCPNTVMEAMACSCPLILSDIPAHRALLGSDSALFVDPMNIQEIAENILLSLHNMNAAKARALIARQEAQEFSISEMARNYERVYQEII